MKRGDQTVARIHILNEELSTLRAELVEHEQRFEEFLTVLSSMAALDFSGKASLGTGGSILDAVALGINQLSEELAASVVSRTYVNAILESMLDALVVTDLSGSLTMVNRAAALLFGVAREQLIGRAIGGLFAWGDVLDHVLAALRGGSAAVSEEVVCITSSGRSFPASLTASPMHGAPNELLGIVYTIRDLTERRAAEEALRRSIVQEETIRAQEAALTELSTPLIPISDQVVVMPLIGTMDSHRAHQMFETLMEGISRAGVQTVIIDITGVPVVDTQVANVFIQAARAVQLLGARVMLTGIRPEVAQTLVGLGIDLSTMMTRSTLQSGIAAVLRRR